MEKLNCIWKTVLGFLYREINEINTHAKPRSVWHISLWKHISRINQVMLNASSFCDFIRLWKGLLSYVVIVCVCGDFSGMGKARIDWQDRLTVETGTSLFHLLSLTELGETGLSWPCVAQTRHISLHRDLSNTTSKAGHPYTKMQLWGRQHFLEVL